MDFTAWEAENQAYFDKTCRTHGRSYKALGWSSPYTQRLRYVVLSTVSDWSMPASVLDVGCGQGDLLGFFLEEQLPVSYSGIDLSESMINEAQNAYSDGVFSFGDFMAAPYGEGAFDYVFASGIFNLKVADQQSLVAAMIARMFRVSKKGVAFNLLSSFTPDSKRENKVFYYYDPMWVLSLCFRLTPFVSLRHDYLENDFSVFLLK